MTRARSLHEMRPWFVMLALGTIPLLASHCLQFEPPRTVTVRGFGWALPESCWWQQALGRSCPGCGLTRSFILAGQANFAAAWRMHPGGTLLFATLQVVGLFGAVGIVASASSSSRSCRDRLFTALCSKQKLIAIGLLTLFFVLSILHWLGATPA